ncbi:MAG: hypothetical protein JKX78_08850 [Alteromonadaceae bacterium]|nr:hypothetical protein [Alteromonadaceae bacterium]
MEKKAVVQVGGNVESAIKGDYQINVALVLKEAWGQTQQGRQAINLGLVFIFVIGMLVSFVVGEYFGGIEAAFKQPKVLLFIQTVVSLAIWPFLAGIEMMGVLHAVGAKTQPKLIFSFLKRGSWVVICGLFTSALVSIGIQLFVIPGVFLAVIFSLTIPLVVEKKFSPIKAMVVSLQAIRFQWFKLFSIYVILLGLLVLAMTPLLITGQSSLAFIAIVLFLFALSYLAPLFYNVKGILYREIFGLTLHKKNIDSNELSSEDDIFIA